MRNSFYLSILIFPFLTAYAQNLQVIKTNTATITIKDGNNLKKNVWTIAPEYKPDIYSAELINGKSHKVTFYTDIDSISFIVELGKEYDFIILHGNDSCYTQIKGKKFIPQTIYDNEYRKTIRSVILKELKTKFLENRNKQGFWNEVQRISVSGGYPFIEEIENPGYAPDNYVRLTFLHKEGVKKPENVILFANINHVVPEELLFEEIDQTGVYFKTVEVPKSVRFEYRIIENDPLTGIFAGAKYGTRMHLLEGDPDPFNQNKNFYKDGLGVGKDLIETWVELEGAPPQPYIVEVGNTKGKLLTEIRESATLGYSRKLFTYLPPNYDNKKEYPFLILFDGGSYFSYSPLQTTLENLIAEGLIPPLIVLGIDAGKKDGKTQRNDEFTCNPEFMKFLNDELLPWFTSKYSVSRDPNQRIIAGSSFGGLFSMYFAFNNPKTVAHVLSQSGSFHWGRNQDEIKYEWLIREFAFSEKRPITIFMEVGLLEGEYSWAYPNFPHQVVSHRHFKTILDMKGYDVTYQEYSGGHEMLSWRGGIAEGLIHIFKSIDLN